MGCMCATAIAVGLPEPGPGARSPDAEREAQIRARTSGPGFHSLGSFSSSFRAFVGESPSAYRARQG